MITLSYPGAHSDACKGLASYMDCLWLKFSPAWTVTVDLGDMSVCIMPPLLLL